MGFLKKLFNDVGDAIKNNVEERKQEIRQNIEESKQQFYESIEERKKEVLSKLGVISEETDQQSASIYDAVTTSDDNNCKLDGSIVEETAKNKQEQEHEESMKEDNYPEVGNECKSEIQSNPSAEEGGIFSARLESIIAAALQDGVLTDKEREILKRRVEKEGEDWDEVEMIIDSRLAEMQSSISKSNTETLVEQKVVSDISEIKEKEEFSDDEEEFSDDEEELSDDEEELSDDEEELSDDEEETDDGTQYTDDEDEDEMWYDDHYKKYLDNLRRKGNIAIREGVKIIKKAFSRDWTIKKLILPSSLEKIEDEAFKECENLVEIDFSRCTKLKSIGEHAFSDCKKLQVVDLSKCTSIEYFEDYAFSGCISAEFVLPTEFKSLKEIGDSAFEDCKKITSFPFSESLTKISETSFHGCSNLQIFDFSKCKELHNINYILIYDRLYPRRLDSLKKIVLPPSQSAFNALCVWTPNVHIGNATNQVEVDMSHCNNFKEVWKGAFQTMDLKEIIIPDTVETIGKNAFDECKDLKTIVMPAALKEIQAPLGGWLEQLKKVDFSKVTQLKVIPKTLFGSGCYKLKELIIPQGVVEIEDDAFNGLSYLKRLFLPPSLTEIGDLGHSRLSVFCYSPHLDELEPIVYGWDDDEDELDEDELDEDELEELKEESKKMKINLYVLPQYVDAYTAQRDAEGIPENVLPIQPIPDEYLYYYDN